jgi:hypothetical protein
MAVRKESKEDNSKTIRDDIGSISTTIIDPIVYKNDIIIPHEESHIMKVLHDEKFKRAAKLEIDMEDIQYRIDEETRIYSLMRETACTNFNEEYVADIEHDRVFIKGSGETFNTQYIRSTMGAVRIWAESKKRLIKLQHQHKEIIKLLEKQKQEYYNTPSDLYRIIFFLKDELHDTRIDLQDTNTELQKIRRHMAALL